MVVTYTLQPREELVISRKNYEGFLNRFLVAEDTSDAGDVYSGLLTDMRGTETRRHGGRNLAALRA